MTDKLKELVGKWDQEASKIEETFGKHSNPNDGVIARTSAGVRRLLSGELSALLDEQAPAGELQAPERKPINTECPSCQAKLVIISLGPWRASDLAEPRDPAATQAKGLG